MQRDDLFSLPVLFFVVEVSEKRVLFCSTISSIDIKELRRDSVLKGS